MAAIPLAKANPSGGAFEGRQALLQSGAGRVGGTAVVVPQMLSHPRLGVRGSLEDGGHDRARAGVGGLAGVNGQRLKAQGAGPVPGRPVIGEPGRRGGPSG